MVKEKKKGLKLNGTQEALFYADYMNIEEEI
jgi:hypothetical protein